MDSGKLSETEMLCPACEGRARAHSPLRTHHAPHNLETYTLQDCPTCQMKFWWPLQADPSVYAEEGFEAYADYHSGKRPFPRWAEPLFRHLPTPAGRALDVGCGDGAVLRRLSESGFDPHGIDLDPKSVAIARGKFDLTNAKTMTLDEFERECIGSGLQFDLITFFEVLEHQDSPRSFLRQIHRLGRPGAVIAGSVPNRNRFAAGLDRKLSDGDLPPHHFLWFSANSLRGLLERSGFEAVEVSTTGALDYRQLVGKLKGIVVRKSSALPKAIGWTKYLLLAFMPVAAIVPWFGMRASPSHLFFKCRVPASPGP